MNKTFKQLSITALGACALSTLPAQGGLIAHYTFDSESAGTTADEVGSASATLGNRVQINTTVADRLGDGALEMLGSGETAGPGDGATTSNSFIWTSNARTLTFWWRADNPNNVNALDGTFVSFGDESGNGTRFDVKEQDATSTKLRVEVQGTGQNTNPITFDDGNWHFVVVTVPDAATFADIAWYAGVRGGTLSGDLNTSTNSLDIATGAGPITFGDSILAVGTNDRVPNGYLDDFQLYDEVLTTEQIASLYNNPGSVIPEPGSLALLGLGGLLVASRRRRD
ncbi:MAG: LamG-like jellyroll fold domain-containing protein [Phycisphaeraceae bacterium]